MEAGALQTAGRMICYGGGCRRIGIANAAATHASLHIAMQQT
jgi:hypothetical protein